MPPNEYHQRGKATLYRQAEGLLDKMETTGIVSLTGEDLTIITFYVLSNNSDLIIEKQGDIVAELRKANRPFKIVNGVGTFVGSVLKRFIH